MGGHSIAHVTRHQRHADIFIQCVRSALSPSHAGYGTRLHVLLVNALAGTNGRKVQLGPNGVPPLPYVAPFTVCVVELLDLIRNFILDRCVASCTANAQQGRTQAQGPSHTLQRNTCILPAHNRRNLSDLVTMHEGACKALAGPVGAGADEDRTSRHLLWTAYYMTGCALPGPGGVKEGHMFHACPFSRWGCQSLCSKGACTVAVMLQLDVPAGPVQPVGAAASSVLPAGQDAQQGMNPRQQHRFEPPTLAIW
jgi:hypothetical protein